MIPIGAVPTGAENAALVRAIEAYQAGGTGDQTRHFRDFLAAYPSSAWKASLETNLGLVYRRTGYYSRALAAWESAWGQLKSERDLKAAPVGDRAVGELVEILARLGRVSRLEEVLQEVGTRKVRGSASEKLISARESLNQMKLEPERNFRCGPVSLASIRSSQGNPEPRLFQENCTSKGTSLAHNAALATKYGMEFQMAKREAGAAVVVPSLVHWKSDHFAAVVKESNGRYLLQDPIFPDDIWVTKAALDEEASGYALVPKGTLPKGWKSVPEAEGQLVWGKGGAPWGDKRNTGKWNSKENICPNKGMAVHSFHSLVASLSIADTPVGYVPAKGPAAMFEVTYIQREEHQPQTFTYSNLGPKWTFDFLGYIEDDPTIAVDSLTFSMRVWSYERGGGMLPFDFSQARGADVATSSPTGPSLSQRTDHSRLVRMNLNTYVRFHPDGTQEIYDQPDGARTYPRRVFLTKVVDPTGATLKFTYDAQLRLVTVEDAQSNKTTLSYELAADPLKITKVTDPFQRVAKFEYNAAGQLSRITDVVGITSEFSYGPTSEAPDLPADFINTLTTPYGSHHYTTGLDTDGTWVEAKDPLGNRERMEFKRHPVVAAQADPFPPGFAFKTPGGSFYWGKRTMALYPGDYNQAKFTRWVQGADGQGTLDIPFALKPAGSPIFTTFFTYPGQTSTTFEGTLGRPSRVIHPQPDGTYVESRFEYNALGRPTKSIDPLGRETTFVYGANTQDPNEIFPMDLKEVRQTSHGRNDLLASYTYNAKHLPLTVTDAAGQVTTLTYNAAGQVETLKNALGQVTTLGYNALDQLHTITAPGQRVTTLEYDQIGRVWSVTNPEGQVLLTEYDALDRPTRMTYPDGTTEELHYDRLDVTSRKDRSGKWTTLTYNALRQLVEVQDALGRSTRFDWCGCGVLEGLTDPMNKVTSWVHDLQGHVTGKLFPDGGRVAFIYDALGQLSQRVDAKGQVTRYAYQVDGALKEVSYFNTVRPEPTVTYQYETDYARLSSISRNGQQIQYDYAPITSTPALGAGRLSKVTGPLPTDLINYGYDELGRAVRRDVKGRASNVGFDALGRVQTVANPLGTFTYGFEGNTGRLSSVTNPNGINTAFTYFGADQENRLQSIQHKNRAGELVSNFAYTYDVDGQIKTWTQTPGPGDPRTFEYTYDSVGQLLTGTLSGMNGQVLRRFAYGYDTSGNRTSETVDGRTSTGVYNESNQLMSLRSSTNDAPIARPTTQPLKQSSKASAKQGSRPATATKAPQRSSN